MALQDSAMLVSLTLTQWSARKLDKTTSYEVCDSKNADQGSGNVSKQIIPKKYLKNIQQLVNKIRNYHYANTLAWTHKGADLLPSRNFMKYTRDMGDLEAKFHKAVDEFLDNYPTIIQQVQNNLNDWYDDTDYPNVDEIKRKFRMEIDMTPVPDSGDFRIDINQKELDKLKTKLDEQLNNAKHAAEQDLFSRLYTTLAKAVLTLRIPGKIFRNTLILNIEETAKQVPDLNVNDNKQLNSLADEIYQAAKAIDIDELRDDEDTSYRFITADELENYMQRAEAIYLGANDETETDASTDGDTSTQQTAA
jgi:hypothetical protein